VLQQTDAIALGKLISQTDSASSRCELMIDGKSTGQRLDGYYLEAALECNVGYLIFLTHDCPFEETLSIYLIDHVGILQDKAHICAIYTTGIFSNLKIQQPDKVFFEFFAEGIFTVQILPGSVFRIPFFSEPRGVYRSFGFKCHFIVVKEIRYVKN